MLRGEGGEDFGFDGDRAAGGDGGDEGPREEVDAGVDEAVDARGLFPEGGDEPLGVEFDGTIAAGFGDGRHEDFSTVWKNRGGG